MSEAPEVIGGIFSTLILAIVVVPAGGFLGYSIARGGIAWWLIATATPAIVFGLLFLLIRGRQPAFAKGMLIGLCVVVLIAGICSGAVTGLGREVPSIELWS